MIMEEASPESVVSLALSSRGWRGLVVTFIGMKRPPSLLKLQTLYRMGVDDNTIIKLLSGASWVDLTTTSVCRLTWTPDKKFSHVRLSPFHVVAAKGNKEMVAFFIDKHCYTGSRHYRYSVTKCVVRAGNLEMLDFLIEKGLPEARSGSLVSVAAAAGHDKIVDRLLELNPGLLAKWGGWNVETQITPLMAAMSSTDAVRRKMVPHLLLNGAVFTEWDIRWACRHGFEDRLIAAQWGNFNCDRRTEDAKGAIMQRFTSLCQTEGDQGPIIEFIDSICHPNAECDPIQAAECLDAAAPFLGKEGAFPWRAYKNMQETTFNMVARRCQPGDVDRMFECMPHILSIVHVLLERYPEKFEPDVFPSMILELIQNIVARDLSLDLDGCQTLLQNTPMKNNWNENSWHENSFR
ncbi:hypothetical protein NCS56_01498000 [Fusarium sp. Ph1]|nr:hypothetical protein NCS56_01498000 [Fusarium sp. Ph1]